MKKKKVRNKTKTETQVYNHHQYKKTGVGGDGGGSLGGVGCLFYAEGQYYPGQNSSTQCSRRQASAGKLTRAVGQDYYTIKQTGIWTLLSRHICTYIHDTSTVRSGGFSVIPIAQANYGYYFFSMASVKRLQL